MFISIGTMRASKLLILGLFLPFATSCFAPRTPESQQSIPPTPIIAPSFTVTTPHETNTPTQTVAPAISSSTGTPNIEVFAKNLVAPWAIERATDGRFFITERPGRIRIIKDERLVPEPWMTLDVASTGEAGLLGLALDPRFNENHFVYVAYTARDGNRLINRLVRLREDANNKGALDRVLIDNVTANGIHDGGRVKFGPDGKLYWTMGDANDRPRAQDLNSLNGKILRLNSDGSVPSDNPFPGSFVYSYGHRNPQGLAWQPRTDRLYETEHGPSTPVIECCRDEVNFIEPGKNYGWSLIIGDQTREGMLAPILHSGNDVTWAPSGATFVSHGPWAGSLLFTGLRGVSLYRIMIDPKDPRKTASFERLFENKYGRLRDVYESPDGAWYVLTNNRDGRGSPIADDDRVLKLTFK